MVFTTAEIMPKDTGPHTFSPLLPASLLVIMIITINKVGAVEYVDAVPNKCLLVRPLTLGSPADLCRTIRISVVQHEENGNRIVQ